MGKKRIEWRKDPEILARLDKVEEMHLMWISNRQIAIALKVDHVTIANDLKRLRILWNERLGDSIEARKNEAIASYRSIQKAAWMEFKTVKNVSLNKSAFLNTIKAAEDSIAKILGIEAPVRVDMRVIAQQVADELGLDVAEVMRETEAILNAKNA